MYHSITLIFHVRDAYSSYPVLVREEKQLAVVDIPAGATAAVVDILVVSWKVNSWEADMLVQGVKCCLVVDSTSKTVQ